MSLKHLIRRKTVGCLSRCCGRLEFPGPYSFHGEFSGAIARVPALNDSRNGGERRFLGGFKCFEPMFSYGRCIHSTGEVRGWEAVVESNMESEEEEGEDDETNEYLSRFVAIMRRKISEAYPDCDKPAVDNMLLVIVQKVVSEMEKGGVEHLLGASAAAASPDFSEDLWKTVWEVSNSVLEDMEKERKKEKMKKFLQCEEVTKMCRFAGEIGIRGDMLREMRFKWAAEKMEESEFYEKLERLRKEGTSDENEQAEAKSDETTLQQGDVHEDKPKVAFLPKRHGKIRYKIYGLDLSDPKWNEVADKIHEAGETVWPQEPKNISGKCKLVNEKVLELTEEDDPSPLLTEWAELLQPNRIDWISLLEKLKGRNYSVYLKVAELLLDETTFQPNVRDYSALIDVLAKGNHLQDAERIIKKMTDNVVVPDMLTLTVLVRMYSNTGNLERTQEAFESLKSYGFIPDVKVYNSMILAYINAGNPKYAEHLIDEMQGKKIKPGREMYIALLKSFAKCHNASGASKIANNMVMTSGYEHDVESFTQLIEAYGQDNGQAYGQHNGQIYGPDAAKAVFDHMISMGLKPDDNCVAIMVRAYQKVNRLDDALDFLLKVEKDGFEPGLATYTVLVDWMGQLQLVDEAEHLLRKIADQGQAPPLQIQVSLCDMYSKARIEKKALQALGVLEANKEQLSAADFERIIYGLVAGGFGQEARRLQEVMKAQGFSESEMLLMTLTSSKATTKRSPSS